MSTWPPPIDIVSRVPSPAGAPSLRWGVLGTGWIAERFVRSAQRHTAQRFVAVGTRDAERGASFARAHGIPGVRVGVQALVTDPDVDIVYIASPHPSHRDHAMAAIDAGKHMLVEKPLSLNANQAREVVSAARRAGVFCAEALWTFFLPRWDVVMQLLDSGLIGRRLSVLAEYGEFLPDDHRAMDPALAGGSLLDLGTYPIALISLLLSTPTRVEAVGTLNMSGVNAQTGALVVDDAGAIGVGYTSLASSTPTTAVIAGDAGAIELPGPFYQPGDVVLRTWSDGEVFRFSEPAIAHDGLHFEAAGVANAVAAGLIEAPQRPLDDTVAFLELMDSVRDRIGARFVGEH